MDPHQISRLREEQLLAIEQTNSRISQFNKYKEDYVALRDRLNTLPDKIQHDVMVPFGDLAFMPGQLIHTNEILVLLGDNWFVDRSASQAADIVERRIKAIDRQIEELEKQKGLLQPRVDFTSQLTDIAEGRSDVQEIREEYDETKEEIWRERHRRSVQKYHEQIRKENEARQVDQTTVKENIKKTMTDEELWARLEELELHEQQGNEMETLSENSPYGTGDKYIESSSDTDAEESEDEETDEGSKKKVRWKEDTGARPKQNVIAFTHTPENPACNTSTTETEEIVSPGDIYKQFVQKTSPTSILKSPSGGFSVPMEEPVANNPQCKVLHVTSDAFTGSIVERIEPEKPSAVKPGTSRTKEGSVEKVSKFKSRQMTAREETKSESEQLPDLPANEDDPPKRVSKFKSQRQQMQR